MSLYTSGASRSIGVERSACTLECLMAPKGTKLVAQNRKARHDYTILETFECGIALKGAEVKSLRAGQVQLRDSYARVDDGEMWLHGVHVAPYANATGWGVVDPDRPRKLLLHRREID